MLKLNFCNNYVLKFTLVLLFPENNIDIFCTSSDELITLHNVTFPTFEQSHENIVLEDNKINVIEATGTSPQTAG